MNRLIFTLFALMTASSVDAQEKHLFILSGQSNMKRLDPETSFSPAVRQAFGEDHVIVVKDAEGGQSIRRWYKKWKDVKNYNSMKPDTSADPSTIGDLYDRLMKQVDAEIAGKSIKTVTFVWMQGEADSGKHYVVYEESLKGLVQQLEEDLKLGKVNV
ncbi:MAG: sialate O-acetylesterase, partial [Rubripirellula sp.]